MCIGMFQCEADNAIFYTVARISQRAKIPGWYRFARTMARRAATLLHLPNARFCRPRAARKQRKICRVHALFGVYSNNRIHTNDLFNVCSMSGNMKGFLCALNLVILQSIVSEQERDRVSMLSMCCLLLSTSYTSSPSLWCSLARTLILIFF